MMHFGKRFSAALVSLSAFSASVQVALAQQQAGLNNPLNSSLSSIPKFIAQALKILVLVALPIISLYIVYSGFMFVSARGSESKLTEAKNNFFYVIVGAILILGAWVIATLIAGTIGQLTTGS